MARIHNLGYDWEIMSGSNLIFDDWKAIRCGIAKHQLGIGIGCHIEAGSRPFATI